MHESERDGLRFYRFDHLADCAGLSHAVFTRLGGASAPPFDSLNITFGLGDNPDDVHLNRRRILQTIDDGAMVFLRQVHGNRVLVVEKQPSTKSAEASLPAADALITSTPGLTLAIQVADCQPVLLYDPGRHVVANVHAGWRGSLADILGRTVAVMVAECDSRPADILAGIGPSLGPCCAEFRNHRTEIPKSFWAYKDDRDHFDFWAVSADQLYAAGLRRENIEVSRICTRCANDRFFSYRADKTTGRFAAVIGLNP